MEYVRRIIREGPVKSLSLSKKPGTTTAYRALCFRSYSTSLSSLYARVPKRRGINQLLVPGTLNNVRARDATFTRGRGSSGGGGGGVAGEDVVTGLSAPEPTSCKSGKGRSVPFLFGATISAFDLDAPAIL